MPSGYAQLRCKFHEWLERPWSGAALLYSSLHCKQRIPYNDALFGYGSTDMPGADLLSYWKYSILFSVAGLLSHVAFAIPLPIPETVPQTSLNPEITAPKNTPSNREFNLMLSVWDPIDLSLDQGRYRTDYVNDARALPMVTLSYSAMVGRTGSVEVLALSSIGISSRMGLVHNVMDLQRQRSLQSGGTGARLTSIPILVGMNVRLATRTIPFLKPGITFATGSGLMLQSGGTPEAEGLYWVPLVQARPSLEFVDPLGDRHWIGGFSFGVTFFRSVLSQSTISGHSWDLALSFHL